MPPILIDIETATGARVGPGPLSALNWRHVQRLDRDGDVSFDAPATDSRVGILALRRYARCHGQIAGTRTELGLGIIDKIDLDTNQREVSVSGRDLMRELALRSVGGLVLAEVGELPMTIADALDEIIALAPGWTIDRTTYASTTVDLFYTFSGESVLAALAKVGALTGTHFRLGTDRQIVWLFDAQPDSGVRAVIGVDAQAAETNRDICLITGLTYVQDSSEVISRVYPHGSGTGANRLDLSATTRSAPAGYVLSAGSNYIERTAAESDYGFAERHQSFNDIAPSVADTDPNYAAAVVSASDTLFDVALEYLRTHSYPQETYKLSVTKLDRLILPGETIRVIYNGWATVVDGLGRTLRNKWVDVDADLIVLESTTEITDAGIHMPSLTVATIPRYPVSDRELVVSLARQVVQAQAHDQPVMYAQSAGSATPTTHGSTHVTGAADPVPVANGSTGGLMSAADFTKLAGVASGATANVGTVTSVDVSVPAALLSASGGPVTVSGTIALALATQAINTVLAGPASGSSAAPTFRALVKADLPSVTAYTDATNTFTVNQTINKAAGVNTFLVKAAASGVSVQIDGAAGNARDIQFLTAGSLRFLIRTTATAESGSAAGSNWTLSCYDDSGVLIATVLSVARSTGVVTIGSDVTMADTKNLVFSATTGTKIGTSTTQKLAFHNATPVAQRAGAAQAAVATTGATNTTPYGFTTAAQADAIVTLLNELRAALVEKGIIKGSA